MSAQLLVSGCLAIVLARLSFSSYASDSVIWPLAIHCAAIAVFLAFFRTKAKAHSQAKASSSQLKPTHPFWFAPTAIVWIVSVGWWWQTADRSTAIPMDYGILASITLVPFAEELYFRIGLSELWRRAVGPIIGSIASALYFAVLHGDGEIFSANILTWLPLGPFLLALCCEILYRNTQNIRVACYFHLSCNLSAVLFYQGVPMDFLRHLYQ